MNIHKLTFTALALGAIFAARPANAHFLWGEVSDDKEPMAKLAFSDNPGQVSEADLVERIKTARAWNVQGKDLTFKTAGAVRSGSLQGSHVFGSSQIYGVLDKTKEGRGVFKLLYWAKAADSLDGAGQNVKLPFEFFARRGAAGEIIATLQRSGQPVAQTTVNLYEPSDEKPRSLTSDAKGEIRFEAKTPGLYGLRAAWVDETPGELDGKKYPFVRNYTTLAFPVSPVQTRAAAAMTPTGNPKADPQAYKLLEDAHNNRQVMPVDFSGFSADLVVRDGADSKSGTLSYRRQGKTDIKVDGLSKDDTAWMEDKVMNLIGHRRGGSFAEGDGKNPLTLAPDDGNAFGRLIKLNDKMNSEYRVKDGKVTEVTRVAGGMRFTISVVETMEAEQGKYLANHFMVAYRDAITNELKEVEGYRDSYSKIDGVWIPLGRMVIDFNGSTTPRVRTIRFNNVKFLEPVKVAATQ